MRRHGVRSPRTKCVFTPKSGISGASERCILIRCQKIPVEATTPAHAPILLLSVVSQDMSMHKQKAKPDVPARCNPGAGIDNGDLA